MNYRHDFHAGNFADVLKHVILMRILTHLRLKPAPFRVIDTHAGSGIYDLSGEEAQRTGEWRGGVGRMAEPFSPASEAVLAAWREALVAICPDGRHYPGSPLFIRHGLREQDRAAFNESHPAAEAALRKALPRRDDRLAITALDAYTIWNAQVPPNERRGLVLVDPPFESRDEFERLARGVKLMARKWTGGSLAVWYPIKDRAAVDGFEKAAVESGFPDVLVAELHTDRFDAEGPLAACGMLVANPPYTLEGDLATLLPELAGRLATGRTARYRLDWLAKN